MRSSLLLALIVAGLLGGCLSSSRERRSDDPASERPRSDLLPSSSPNPRRE